MRPIAITVLALIANSIYCRKLTDSENVDRLETCGRQQPDATTTPWMASIHFEVLGTGSAFVSASVVSKRHVLTDSSLVFNWDPNMDGSFLHYFDRSAANLSACENSTMQIPDRIVKSWTITVFSEQKFHGRNASRAVYIGNCMRNLPSFGLILIETELEIDASTAVPICVPHKSIAFLNETVEYFGLESTKHYPRQNWSESIKVNTVKAVIKKCEVDKWFNDISVCISNQECLNDLGGPFVKRIDGVAHALAVSHYSFCQNSTDEWIDRQLSVEAFSSEICAFSGVCPYQVPPISGPLETSSSTTEVGEEAEEEGEEKEHDQVLNQVEVEYYDETSAGRKWIGIETLVILIVSLFDSITRE
ncbi:unnamed protein product [Caenorhabditis sp. 36 PRJEB53466]|nr:unnamed protein product [Caenorhabditis sp. 36 PRJEB53466]